MSVIKTALLSVSDKTGIAEFIRDQVVPQADIVTPNAFELEYLSGRVPDTTVAAITAIDARSAFVAPAAPSSASICASSSFDIVVVTRHARTLLVQGLRRKMLDMQGFGLALEGLANLDDDPSDTLQRDFPGNTQVRLRR